MQKNITRALRKSMTILALFGFMFGTGIIPHTAWAAAPTAANKSITLQEDQPGGKNVILSATGSRGETFTYTIVSLPTSGTVSLSGNIATYTPRTNFFGTDSFTYQATGSKNGTSNIATVSITVNSVNDQPQATAGLSAVTTKNTPVNFSVGGTDVETSALTCALGTISNGTASISGCNITFTPKNNYTGTGSVAFRVSDGSLYSTYATVTITINNSNTAPVATPSSATLNEDQTKTILLQGTDVDMQSLTATIATLPEKGSLTLTSGNQATYTPQTNICGTDRFTFTVSDGTLISEPAEITLTISCINDYPTAQEGITFSMPENTSHHIMVLGTDSDGDTLSYSAEPTTIGTWSIDERTGEATYTPPQNFEGNVTLRFRVFDGQTYSSYAAIQGTVTRVNVAPEIPSQEKTLWEDTSLLFPLNGTDADLDTLSYRITEFPQSGTAILDGGSITYTPNSNFTGTDVLTVIASDGNEESTPATITLVVQAVNDLPRGENIIKTTTENNSVSEQLQGTDEDGDSLTFSISSFPQHGKTEIEGNIFTYTPDENFIGTDTLTYSIFDGTGYGFATITITVEEPTHPANIGTLAWMRNLGDGYVSGPPTYYKNHLYFGLFEGTGSDLYSVDLLGNITSTFDIGLHTESAALIQEQADGSVSLVVNTIHNFGNAEDLYGTEMETIGEYRIIDLLGTVSLKLHESGSLENIAWANASTAYGRDGSPGQSEDGSVIYVADVWDPATADIYDIPAVPYFTALSATSGEILAEAPQLGWSYSSPTFIPNTQTPEINDGIVIIGGEIPDSDTAVGVWGGHGGTGILRAFPVGFDGVFSQEPIWEVYDDIAPFDRGPSATWINNEAILFAGTMAGDIYAIRAQTGEVLWKTSLGATGFGTPVVSSNNETLFVVTGVKEKSVQVPNEQISKLIALNITTGEITWTKNILNEAATAIVGNGVVYVVGTQEVIAVNEETGVQIWDYDLTSDLSPYYGYATLVPETGLLVFGAGTNLMAIQTESTQPSSSYWANYRGNSAHQGVLWVQE